MAFFVQLYGGDGVDVRSYEWGPFDTLDDAREFIRDKRLGGQTFGSYDRGFSESDEERGLVECWHESAEEGCGGYGIYQTVDASEPA